MPEISAPIAFDSLLTVTNNHLRLMFSERGGDSFESVATEKRVESVIALVGSEGGWSDEEIQQAKAQNFHTITLGGRILSAETAAISDHGAAAAPVR